MKVKRQVKARFNLLDENEIKLKFGESENECDIRAFTRSMKRRQEKLKVE